MTDSETLTGIVQENKNFEYKALGCPIHARVDPTKTMGYPTPSEAQKNPKRGLEKGPSFDNTKDYKKSDHNDKDTRPN